MYKKIGGKVDKICLVCFVNFKARHDRVGKFCSRECARKLKYQPNHKVSKKCLVCDKEFLVKRHQKDTARYCSAACRRKKMPSGENHPNWKGGISKRSYKSRKIIALAKKIKEKCEKCGSRENLQGHHVVKYSEDPSRADDINNIEVICATCHAAEHPEWKNMISVPRIRSGIYRACNVCAKSYYVKLSAVKNSKFCSQKCQLYNLHQLNKNY